MVSDGRVSGGEVYVATAKLVEEGPIWDTYFVNCSKCGKHLRFLWRHILYLKDDATLETTDVYCECGEIIPTLVPSLRETIVI